MLLKENFSNEQLQSLNYGHYDLASLEDCEQIFAEFYFKG